MLCCGQCFQDRGLREEIIPRLASEKGLCPTCKSEDQHLVDAKKLGDYFELLCGIYVPGAGGKVLVEWLMDDWQLFPIHRDTANALLVEILDDGERVRQPLIPSDRCHSDRLNRWEELRDELRHKNRFFPETDFEHERLEVLLQHLMRKIDDDVTTWYRARIQKGQSAFSSEQMGAPPNSVAAHGRANPAGIPYLYLGSEPYTAVAEVRPYPGEPVCVAEFQIPAETQVVDLRNPRQLASPFLLEDENEIAQMRGDIEFLERLGKELTTPVLPNAAAIDYIPSQYLCEFIKRCGHKGVLYSSSVSDGFNLAFFDPATAAVGNMTQYRIDRVSVDMSATE